MWEEQVILKVLEESVSRVSQKYEVEIEMEKSVLFSIVLNVTVSTHLSREWEEKKNNEKSLSVKEGKEEERKASLLLLISNIIVFNYQAIRIGR